MNNNTNQVTRELINQLCRAGEQTKTTK